MSYRLQQIPEIAEQKCFSFEINGINYWLPKFELARKLFFHAGFIVRAAYQPHGLDLLFSIQKDEDKNIPIYISSDGNSFSLNEILHEIRTQSEIGKSFSRKLNELTIDLLLRKKENLDG